MSYKHTIIKGTVILTITSFITKIIGFFFRIFLSHSFSAEQIGLYQLIFPAYIFCSALCIFGIQTALSRCVAEKISQNKQKDADFLFYFALCISVTFSIIICIVIQNHSSWIATNLLGDSRCAEMLNVLMWALPLSSIHACVCGYYIGQRKTVVPAVSQLLEQITRVGGAFLITNLFHSSIVAAVLGIVIGEFFSAFFCLNWFCRKNHTSFHMHISKSELHLIHNLMNIAMPLSATRVITTLLHSVEAISIPLFLQKYGYSSSESLSIYGILTGMALPCILFPSALTNSISTLLLPTVAEIQSRKNIHVLRSMIRKVNTFSVAFGSICCLLFFTLGPLFGHFLFHNELSGNFIQILAWLCPFLYLNTTLISTINGLGKTNYTFFFHMLEIGIRILSVWFIIPAYGMQGYLIGLLISQCVLAVVCIGSLNIFTKTKEPI